MNRLYLLQRQPQWSECKHWAAGLEWLDVGGPVIIDGFKAVGTVASITVRMLSGEPRIVTAADFDVPTIAKLVTRGHGIRSAELYVIAAPWGEQDLRGEIDTTEYLRKLESRRASHTLVAP